MSYLNQIRDEQTITRIMEGWLRHHPDAEKDMIRVAFINVCIGKEGCTPGLELAQQLKMEEPFKSRIIAAYNSSEESAQSPAT